jgi:hypothetical protein
MRPCRLAPIFAAVAGLCLALPAFAEDGKNPELEQAEALQAKGAQIRKEAEAQFAADEAACQKKFAVNDCVIDARARQKVKLDEARKLEAEGRQQEYDARVKMRAQKQAGREANIRQRQAEMLDRQKQLQAEQAKKEAALAKKRAKRAEALAHPKHAAGDAKNAQKREEKREEREKAMANPKHKE